MACNLLILGGTTEATALCRRVADAGLAATLSLAGRVARPQRQPLPMREGGFGGVEGLVEWLQGERVSHVVDATHPFAARMSANAAAACTAARVPLIALTRAPWVAGAGDRWQSVPDIAGAVAALDGPRRNVMLAIGRMHLAAFSSNPQHRYLLRLVDPPEGRLPFPDAEVVIDRGPFTLQGDRALMERHGIEVVVSKNAGGTGAVAKIEAARALGLPVVMIDRPVLPARREVHAVDDVMAWLAHASTDLGV